MGYTTDFEGQFDLDRPLAPEHLAYLVAFNETRRMHRNAEMADMRPDPIRKAAGLPIGDHGGYFVGADNTMGVEGQMGNAAVNDVIDHNRAPGTIDTGNFGADYKTNNRLAAEGKCQPGLWCGWRPNEEGTAIEWDQTEKFYSYIEWIKYLIKHFLEPWGYVLNGDMNWSGEETTDVGVIRITNNKVLIGKADIRFELDE